MLHTPSADPSSVFALPQPDHLFNSCVKKKILVAKRGIGYKPLRKGQKRRKTVRGNEVTYDMTLINLMVVKYGEAELFKKE